MPGNPKWRAFLIQVDERGGEAALLARVANAETLVAIGRSFGVGRGLVYRYIAMSQERVRRYHEAKAASGEAHLELAQEIANDADEMSPGGVSKAKLQVDTHKWIAGIRDKSLGTQPNGTGMTINIGQLHLAALQSRGTPANALPLPVRRVVENIEDAVLEAV